MIPTSNDLLKQLDDISGLDAISWWPLAPGWWVLIGVVVAATILYSVIYWRRRAYSRSWRGDAKRAFDALDRQSSEAASREIVTALADLLRRVAIRRFSRAECAGLVGHAWLQWLTLNDPGSFDWLMEGTLLVEAPYAPPGKDFSVEKVRALIGAAKNWAD